MRPYPASIGSCKGDCGQNSANCKTRPLCQLAMHRVTLSADEVTRAEYKAAVDYPITMEDGPLCDVYGIADACWIAVICLLVLAVILLPVLMGTF